MVRHVWSVLCDRVQQDLRDGRLSLVDLAQEIFVEGTLSDDDGTSLGARVDLYIVSYWLRDQVEVAEDGWVRLSVKSPDGSETEAATRNLDLSTESRTYTVFRVDVLPVVQTGRFEFRLSYRADEGEEWKFVAEVPLDIAPGESAS